MGQRPETDPLEVKEGKTAVICPECKCDRVDVLVTSHDVYDGRLYTDGDLDIGEGDKNPIMAGTEIFKVICTECQVGLKVYSDGTVKATKNSD